jgi:hypothetical protein
MRKPLVLALFVALMVPAVSRANWLITASGTVQGMSSNEPGIAGPTPTSFSLVADFAPQYDDRQGLHGPIAWTLTLDDGRSFSNDSGAPQNLHDSALIGFDGSNDTHGYTLNNRLHATTDNTDFVDELTLSVTTGASFPGYVPDSLGPLADLQADSGLLQSATVSITRIRNMGVIPVLLTGFGGTVTSLQVEEITPEPGTLAAALVGGVALLAWVAHRRGRLSGACWAAASRP